MFGAIVLIVFSLFANQDAARTITVLDHKSGKPVQGVSISCGTRHYYTDSDGKAFQVVLKDSREISFEHPSYIPVTISAEDLRKANYRVHLHSRVFSGTVEISSATKRKQSNEIVPGRIKSISAEDAEIHSPQTTADLLGDSGEVFIQKSQLGGGSPMIRGFSANRVLIVVDDVRMNNAIFRGGNLQNVISIDPGSVEKTEVVFGPGSIIYGSDAMGGVMAFHTLTPEFTDSERVQLSGKFFTRYASANSERTDHLDFALAGKNWASLTSVTYSDFSDLRMGSEGRADYLRPEFVLAQGNADVVVENNNPELQRFSGYNQVNFMQKFIYSPFKDLSFSYTFHYSDTSEIPRYDRLIERRNGTLRYAQWYYGPQKWQMHSASAELTKPTPLFDRVKIIAAYQFFEESRHDRKLNDVSLRHRTETVDAWSLNLDFDKGFSDEQTLYYGVEFVDNSVGSRGYAEEITSKKSLPTSTRYPDGSSWRSLAAYASYSHRLTERTTVSSGLRINNVAVVADLDDTFYSFPFNSIDINTSALTGNLGFVHEFNNSWKGNLNFSTGFRAPNIDDAAKVFDSEPGSVVVPNPDLESEYIWNIDAGLSGLISNNFRVELAGFYSVLTNAIVRRDFSFGGEEYLLYDGELSHVQAMQNAEEAAVFGYQFASDLYLSHGFGIALSHSQLFGETDEGEPLRHVPPYFGYARLKYNSTRVRSELTLNYNGALSYDDLAPSERDKPHLYVPDGDGNPFSPGWYTIDIQAQYYFNADVSIILGLKNLLDRRYRPYSSGIVAPGRNLIMTLSTNF